MNAYLEHTNGRAEIATRAFDKWVHRSRGDANRDWLDAEVEVLQLRKLMRRVAQLEQHAEAGKIAHRRLTDAEAWLARLVVDSKQAAQRLAGEHAVSRLLAESGQFSDAAERIL